MNRDTASAPRDTKRRTIILGLDTRLAHVRQKLSGLARWAAEVRHWGFIMHPEIATRPGAMEHMHWRPDGIIAESANLNINSLFNSSGIPFIELRDSFDMTAPPQIAVDHARLAQVAVDHFMERGYQNLAFIGEPSKTSRRGRFFEEAACRLGITISKYDANPLSAGLDPMEQTEEMGKWLARQPRPLGLFCQYDHLAQTALLACSLSGTSVPEDIGILAPDDDLLNELAPLPISSLVPDHAGVGYQAGRHLHAILEGLPLPPPVRLSHVDLIARASTDRTHTADPLIAAACQWITSHVKLPIGVEDVAHALGIHRRMLERRAKDKLGRGIAGELRRIRVTIARDRLVAGDSVAKAAQEVGLSVDALTEAFISIEGCTPGAWRDHRISSASVKNAHPWRSI